jgi:hypothetical protein
MVVFAVDVEIGMDADEYLLEKDTEAYKQFHVRPAPLDPPIVFNQIEHF